MVCVLFFYVFVRNVLLSWLYLWFVMCFLCRQLFFVLTGLSEGV